MFVNSYRHLLLFPPTCPSSMRRAKRPFIRLETQWRIFTLTRIYQECVEHHDHAASARARVEVLKALGHPIVSVAPTPVLVLA
ncbi:hypothetical protein PQR02_10940 [Paraburkholderia sediminicola]|uniref:Uncharacterized protein n=1 Tax=Paraburkholderia rhynchosiae TaxID=487049 RepID=A0ACC7NIQ5_9BURK